MTRKNEKDMKRLTLKDRADLVHKIQVAIMVAEGEARTQVALDRLEDVQVAENGFWDDQSVVGVDGHWFDVEGPDLDDDDEEEVTDDVLEVLYERLKGLGPEVEVRVTTGMPYVEETKTIGPVDPPKRRPKKIPPAIP